MRNISLLVGLLVLQLFLAIPTTSSASFHSGAPQCKLTLAQAPEIGGIRLGITRDDVTRLLPSIKLRHSGDFTPDQTGLTGRIEVSVGTAEEETRFTGVERFVFKFLDNRVVYLLVSFSYHDQWTGVNQFAAYIRKGAGLPNTWRRKSESENYMPCADFEVNIAALGPIINYVSFNDLLAEKTVAERTAALNDKRSPSGVGPLDGNQPRGRAGSDGSPVPFRELRSFQRDGEIEVWRNIVVSPHITGSQLIALAKHLYGKHPRQRFNIFDDDKEFQAFVDWRLHFYKPDHDRYPWPQVWLQQHHLAMINRMSPAEPGTLGWVLLAPSSGSRLAILE